MLAGDTEGALAALQDARSALEPYAVTPAAQSDARRELDREVRAGRLDRWRGYWAPVAGASMGLGPLKTCWGLPSVRAVLP